MDWLWSRGSRALSALCATQSVRFAAASSSSLISRFQIWRFSLDSYDVGICCVLFFMGLVVYNKFRKREAYRSLPVRDFVKSHVFTATDLFSPPSFCNICEQNVVEGYTCDACGLTAHLKCSYQAHRKFRCKAMSSFGPVMKHHVVKGNLPLYSVCCVCHRECGNQPRLCDYRCIWCKRTYHEECEKDVEAECDLGPFKDFIIPPNGVKVKMVGMRPRRQAVVSSVRAPESPLWTPLIVIGNKKSGAGDSALILSEFKRALNPGQVIDINVVKPEEVLGWISLLPDHTCRILVCGGDGTVGWILNTVEKLGLKPEPAVCILPIGTGNDLSNVLGWGAATHLPIDVDQILQRISGARRCKVDRWKVDIHPSGPIGFPLPARTVISNNYISLGVDALVTLNFHRKREQIPTFFASRYMNKFLYFTYGTMDVLERACLNLNNKMSLICDGVAVDLPVIEGIVFLNIPSWGAGVDVWNLNRKDTDTEQHIDDGYFEVLGIYSSFHIAQMQVGLSSPHRLCRAKTAELVLHKSKVPMQVDGEPWEQGPAVIKISFSTQGLMLRAVNANR